jgi:hypothetical protein
MRSNSWVPLLLFAAVAGTLASALAVVVAARLAG